MLYPACWGIRPSGGGHLLASPCHTFSLQQQLAVQDAGRDPIPAGTRLNQSRAFLLSCRGRFKPGIPHAKILGSLPLSDAE